MKQGHFSSLADGLKLHYWISKEQSMLMFYQTCGAFPWRTGRERPGMLLMEGSKAEDSKEKLASAQMGKRGTDRKGNDRDDI